MNAETSGPVIKPKAEEPARAKNVWGTYRDYNWSSEQNCFVEEGTGRRWVVPTRWSPRKLGAAKIKPRRLPW